MRALQLEVWVDAKKGRWYGLGSYSLPHDPEDFHYLLTRMMADVADGLTGLAVEHPDTMTLKMQPHPCAVDTAAAGEMNYWGSVAIARPPIRWVPCKAAKKGGDTNG